MGLLSIELLEWNERFGIRISSEMFPFASPAELGYSLEFVFFLRRNLSTMGKLAMKYGHWSTMPPLPPVYPFLPGLIVGTIHANLGSYGRCCHNSIGDLEYHAEIT